MRVTKITSGSLLARMQSPEDAVEHDPRREVFQFDGDHPDDWIRVSASPRNEDETSLMKSRGNGRVVITGSSLLRIVVETGNSIIIDLDSSTEEMIADIQAKSSDA